MLFSKYAPRGMLDEPYQLGLLTSLMMAIFDVKQFSTFYRLPYCTNVDLDSHYSQQIFTIHWNWNVQIFKLSMKGHRIIVINLKMWYNSNLLACSNVVATISILISFDQIFDTWFIPSSVYFTKLSLLKRNYTYIHSCHSIYQITSSGFQHLWLKKIQL